MKLKLLAIATAALLGSASSASALMVAGWDFSQYFAGALTVDGGTLAGPTLGANWSDLDMGGNTPGLGQNDSALYGTFDLGFQPQGPGVDPVIPQGPSLTSNNEVPAAGTMDFTSQNQLTGDGQLSWNDVAMLTEGALDVSFLGTLAPDGSTGSDWSLSLAARTQLTGTTSEVGVQVSFDGGQSFASAGSFTATSVDTQFVVGLGGTDVQSAIVQLSFADSGVFFDNVAVEVASTSVPEPGTLLLGASGVLGLVVFGRRRS